MSWVWHAAAILSWSFWRKNHVLIPLCCLDNTVSQKTRINFIANCTIFIASSPGHSQLFNVSYMQKNGRAWYSSAHVWCHHRVVPRMVKRVTSRCREAAHFKQQICHKKFGPPFNCSPRSKYFEVLGPLALGLDLGLGLEIELEPE